MYNILSNNHQDLFLHVYEQDIYSPLKFIKVKNLNIFSQLK